MKKILKTIEEWTEKLAAGAIIAFFAEFEISILVLFIVIVLDTVFGIAYALKMKRFSKNRLKNFITKLITYFAAILTVRLIETGLSPIVSVKILTHIITGFLIITESISVLKNLTLLGVPLPAGFVKIIMRYIKSEPLEELLSQHTSIQNYITEIRDMIDFQIPNIKVEKLRIILEITLEEWTNVVTGVDLQFTDSKIEDKDLIYYRLAGLFNTTKMLINEKILSAGIPEECMNAFNTWHNPRMDKWMRPVKEICYSNDILQKKKIQIIEKIIVLLYQTIIDAQKGELLLCKSSHTAK